MQNYHQGNEGEQGEHKAASNKQADDCCLHATPDEECQGWWMKDEHKMLLFDSHSLGGLTLLMIISSSLEQQLILSILFGELFVRTKMKALYVVFI